MSELRQQEVLDELKKALMDIPDKYHKDVCRSLTHDIGVMEKTIKMMEARE